MTFHTFSKLYLLYRQVKVTNLKKRTRILPPQAQCDARAVRMRNSYHTEQNKKCQKFKK